MTTVSGQFDVTLQDPIQVTPEFRPGSVQPFVVTIDASDISIFPQKIPQIVFDDDYPETNIEELAIFIRRPANLAEDATLPEAEKETFVCHIIEATQRLVAATKVQTKQWNLDIRHPVKWYKYKYFCQDEDLGTYWPLGEGSGKTPPYISGSVTTDAAGVIGLLSPNTWEELAGASITIPEYEERMGDARVFASLMHFEAAILYFAMAAELMVIEAAQTLVNEGRIDGSFYGRSGEPIPRKMMAALATLDSSLRELEKDFNKLFDWRRDLAHGRSLPDSDDQVTQAKKITGRIKQNLQDWLRRG